MSWKDILKVMSVPLQPEDECCRRIRAVMLRSYVWEKYKNHWEEFNCSDLRNYLEQLEQQNYDFNRKAAATNLLAAWDNCKKSTPSQKHLSVTGNIKGD